MIYQHDSYDDDFENSYYGYFPGYESMPNLSNYEMGDSGYTWNNQVSALYSTTYLKVFDPRAAKGDGHAAIAFGNPETADHVTLNVPGLTSEMKNFSGVAGDAWNIYDGTDKQGKGSVASIAWLG